MIRPNSFVVSFDISMVKTLTRRLTIADKKIPRHGLIHGGVQFTTGASPNRLKRYLTCLLAYFVNSNIVAELFPPKRGLNK